MKIYGMGVIFIASIMATNTRSMEKKLCTQDLSSCIVEGYSHFIIPDEIANIERWIDERRMLESYSVLLKSGNSALLVKEKNKVSCTLSPSHSSTRSSIPNSNFYTVRTFYNIKLQNITEHCRKQQQLLALRRQSFSTTSEDDLSEWCLIDDGKSMPNAESDNGSFQ